MIYAKMTEKDLERLQAVSMTAALIMQAFASKACKLLNGWQNVRNTAHLQWWARNAFANLQSVIKRSKPSRNKARPPAESRNNAAFLTMARFLLVNY